MHTDRSPHGLRQDHGLVLGAGAQRASAQVIGPIEFTTSFPFTVGYATVPAGSYTIRPDDDNPEMLLLAGARTSGFFQTETKDARQTPSKTEIVFGRYDDKYVLKDIWVEGSTSGSESVAGEGERHMAKHGQSKGEQRVASRRKSSSSHVR